MIPRIGQKVLFQAHPDDIDLTEGIVESLGHPDDILVNPHDYAVVRIGDGGLRWNLRFSELQEPEEGSRAK